MGKNFGVSTLNVVYTQTELDYSLTCVIITLSDQKVSVILTSIDTLHNTVYAFDAPKIISMLSASTTLILSNPILH